MKIRKNILLLFLMCSVPILAQHDRKVLVEIFTNSHCPHCPAAHNVIDDYLGGPNGDKISYIYYHMVYPYSDDQLYIQSMEDSDERDTYYNPVAATPQGWFYGEHQGSSSGWAATLDDLVMMESPLNIILSGTRNASQFNINAELTKSGSISDNDLVIHFVVVEDLYYAGRNGITNHKQVMRKMLPTPDGQTFSINLNETKNIPQTITLDPLWDADSLSVVVFVQSTDSKTVYQSETISYNELSISELENESSAPVEFYLGQNYPNPFNPATSIQFRIADFGFTSLIIYNVLGTEVATLVYEELPAGEYQIDFDASNISTGTYFYTLASGNFRETKKMILLR